MGIRSDKELLRNGRIRKKLETGKITIVGIRLSYIKTLYSSRFYVWGTIYVRD